jgi:hypothetical protein
LLLLRGRKKREAGGNMELHNITSGIARIVFYVVHVMPIARQRIAKHVPTQKYRGTIGRPSIGSGAVNKPTNY